jgi:hypothetical protein
VVALVSMTQREAPHVLPLVLILMPNGYLLGGEAWELGEPAVLVEWCASVQELRRRIAHALSEYMSPSAAES